MQEDRRLLSSVIKTARDIVKSNRAKSELISNLSYELRTVLTSIIGMAQLLTMDCLLPTQQQYVNDILNTSESILPLINRLLNFSKQEVQQIGLKVRPFNLKVLLENVVKQLLFQAQSKGLQLLLDYPKHVPVDVVGDSDLIHQIVIHLGNYALKNTEQGFIIIQVDCTLHNKEKKCDEFSVSIKDSGKGMEEDELMALKACLVPSNFHGTRDYRMIDLGLAITLGYIKLLNASLEIESTFGKGSLFVCRMPLKQHTISYENTFLPQKICLWPRIRKIPIHILLIEDHDVIRQAYKEMLRKIEGCSVDAVSNAELALQYYMQNHYDLILMDICLPDNNGLVLTQIIRQQEAKTERISIIAITALGDAKDREKFFAAGIDEVFIKPIKLGEMLNVLEKWTRLSRL